MYDHWEFVIEYENELRKLCRMSCRGRYDLCDELWSDVVLFRIADICDTWDPTWASLKTHVFRNLRLYMWKWMNRRYKDEIERKRSIFEDEDFSRPENLDAKEEVYCLLEKLDEYDREIITLIHLHNWTIAEVADELDIARTTARRHYLNALKRLRQIAHES